MKKQSTHPEPPENYREILNRRIREIEDGTAGLVSWENVQAEI